MTPQTKNHCSQYIPQWQEKLGWKLFPSAHCDYPEAHGMKDCLVIRITIHVSWPDRIRLLFTGRAVVESKTVTENRIGLNATQSCAYVLPPRYLERKL